MSTRNSLRRILLLATVFVLATGAIVGLTVSQSVGQSGSQPGSSFNLNSPASFPVDI